MQQELAENGFVYVHGFLSINECETLISEHQRAKDGFYPSSAINLNDSNDLCNVVYESSRSPLSYCYLATKQSLEISKTGIAKLEALTGLNWSGNINEKFFPIFMYGDGGYIERHRGRDVGYGRNDYVAVTMLTEPTRNFSSGRFFLNKDASASSCGKIIEYENPTNRVYIDIQQGDLLIFDNRLHVHGTEPALKGSSESVCRMTTSWRMESNA